MSEKTLTQMGESTKLQVPFNLTPETNRSYSLGSRYQLFAHLYTQSHVITNVFGAGPSASPLPSQTEVGFIGLDESGRKLNFFAPTTYSGGRFTAETLSYLNINNA